MLFRNVLFHAKHLLVAEPHSSVGRVADLSSLGRWFDLRFGQYSFRGLLIVIETGFIDVRCFDNVGKQPMAWKESCAEYWLKELHESMDRCTGRCGVTEILLKTGLNTIQSINYYTS